MSNHHEIISATNFNASKDVKFTKPKVNKSGGKSVGILNQWNKPLMLSTPEILTWGVNEFVDEQTGKKSYNMALQFPNDNYETAATSKFLENMKMFEEKLKKDALEYSKEWLNKTKLSAEVVDALFTPMLKYPKDKNTGEPDYTRAPSLNVKIGYWEDKFDCEVYDYNQTQLFPAHDSTKTSLMSLMPKSSHVACILRCGGLWFANGKFGCTWKLVQSAVKPKETMKGKCFISFQGDESGSISGSTSSSSESVQLVDDDDDDEQYETQDFKQEQEQEQPQQEKVEEKKEQQQEVVSEVSKEVEKKTVATKKVVRKQQTIGK